MSKRNRTPFLRREPIIRDEVQKAYGIRSKEEFMLRSRRRHLAWG